VPCLEYLEQRCLPTALTIATATDVAPGASPPGPPGLAPALVNRPFAQTFTALSGTGTDSFSLGDRDSLDGLRLSSAGNVGTLSGTPIAAGSFVFTLRVRDESGATATATYTLNVAASPLVLTSATVTPTATVNRQGEVKLLTVSGGDEGSYQVYIPSETAPDGLSFRLRSTPAGTTLDLTGTPSRPGAFPSFAEVEDDYGNVAVQPFTLLVFGAPGGDTPLTLFSSLNNGRDLPLATVNRAYTQTFGAFGGTGRLTFQAPASVDGLTFSSARTVSKVTSVDLTGAPSAAGSFAFDVTVTDQGRQSVTYSYTLTVNPASLALGPALLRPGTEGDRYVQEVALLGASGNHDGAVPFQLSATGGSGAGYLFAATGLPPGTALTSTGVLCGTPSVAGPYDVDVTVTDGAGGVASGTYALTVLPSPTSYYTPAQIARAYGIDQVSFGGQAGTGSGVTVVILESGDDPGFVSSFDPTYGGSDLARFDKQFGLPDFGNGPGKPVFLKLNASGTAPPGPAAGTISSSGLRVTGAGTHFDGAKAGDYIGNATLGYFKIASIGDDTSLTLATAPPRAFVKASYQIVDSGVGEFAQDVEWVHALAPLANVVVLEGASIATAVNWTPGQLQASVTSQIAPCVLARIAAVSVVSDSIAGNESAGSDNNNKFVPTGSNNVVFVASAGDRGERGPDSGVLWPSASPYVLATGETELVTDSQDNYVGELGVRNTGAGVSAIQDQPAYQNGVVSAFSTANRTTPDVAFVGSENSGVAVFNSWPPGRKDPWGQGNGTSLSAPAWAALIAIADQGRALLHEAALSSLATSPDSVQALLYELSRQKPADFHNVTGMDDGTANPPGYNLHTGLGSPVANLLIPDLVAG
jgi:hypothetical protein